MLDEKQLQKLVLENFAIPLKFCHTRMLFDGRGVMFWPKYDTLVFSDLHFEKGSFLSQFANPLPRFDTAETIKRMGELLDEYQAKQVICLGDSFHDTNADKRIASKDIDALNAMINSVQQWTWILGNHDPDIPATLKGDRAPYLAIDKLLFVHEPEPLNQFPDCVAQVVGHFHPKTRYKIAKQNISGKAFVVAADIILMPAFGKYTGGLALEHEAIQRLYNEKEAQVLLSYNKKLFMI